MRQRSYGHMASCAVIIGALALFTGSLSGCGSPSPAPPEPTNKFGAPDVLSEFALFEGDGRTQRPAEGVIPYDLNTPLFTDYASKYRFIKLPEGTSATYVATNTGAADVEFPVGTIIAKTFAMPIDMNDPDRGERLLETRILMHQAERGWVGLPYVWNDEQSEARLKLGGAFIDLEWTHTDGSFRTNNYIIPNANQCKGCHKAHEKSMAADRAKTPQSERRLRLCPRHGEPTSALGCPGSPRAGGRPERTSPRGRVARRLDGQRG